MGRPKSPEARITFARLRPVVVGFVFVHQLINRRRILDPSVALVAGLDQDVGEIPFAPGDKRLAGEIGGDRKCPALELAAFHR